MLNINHLRYLGNLKHGKNLYFSVLMHDQCELLSVGAACRNIDFRADLEQDFDQFNKLSYCRAVRDRLLIELNDWYPVEMISRVLAQPAKVSSCTHDDLIIAEMSGDAEKIVKCLGELFMSTGEFNDLNKALKVAHKLASIEVAIDVCVINILLSPENGIFAVTLFEILVARGAQTHLREYLDVLNKVGEYAALVSLIKIRLHLLNGELESAEQELKVIDAFELPEPVQFQMNILYAELFDRQGEFQKACLYYDKQNNWIRSENYAKGAYLEHVKSLNEFKFSTIPAESHSNHLMMLGFPRSGTTLLENILASHPSIHTLEEIGTLTDSQTLFNSYRTHNPGCEILPADLLIRMRDAYFNTIYSWHDIKPARVIVDKMPLLSSRGPFLKKMFSNMRYIFSIRHPYDVVLSCYKQAFSTNLGMDCFTSFEESCSTYDGVMNIWFSCFNLNSSEVCYVKYDDLCNNLESEVRRLLNFMDIDWSPSVLDFAENAKNRSQRTPSYAKVKLGNTIGVQSSWKKYSFLFEKPEARVLDKWVKFFGYEGLSS